MGPLSSRWSAGEATLLQITPGRKPPADALQSSLNAWIAVASAGKARQSSASHEPSPGRSERRVPSLLTFTSSYTPGACGQSAIAAHCSPGATYSMMRRSGLLSSCTSPR